jgi:hypothetical protein
MPPITRETILTKGMKGGLHAAESESVSTLSYTGAQYAHVFGSFNYHV